MTSVSVMRFHMVSEDHRGQRIKSGLCLISVNQTSAYSWRGERGEPPVGHGEALFALGVEIDPLSERSLLNSPQTCCRFEQSSLNS